MVNMETIRSPLAGFVDVGVRGDVLIPGTGILCFLHLIAAAITMLNNLLLLLNQSLSHLMHIIRVDLSEVS